TVDGLAAREDPLAVRIPRQPGQREDRYAHLLGGEIDLSQMAASETTDSNAPSPRPPRPPATDGVADLREEVAALRRDLDALRRELGFDA
ncbi:MAG: hypothetical protein JO085_12515, partial [Acidimicrobiia bacterium]|nr:hypothetical protein [Acidimicrobiia bacterium]